MQWQVTSDSCFHTTAKAYVLAMCCKSGVASDGPFHFEQGRRNRWTPGSVRMGCIQVPEHPVSLVIVMLIPCLVHDAAEVVSDGVAALLHTLIKPSCNMDSDGGSVKNGHSKLSVSVSLAPYHRDAFVTSCKAFMHHIQVGPYRYHNTSNFQAQKFPSAPELVRHVHARVPDVNIQYPQTMPRAIAPGETYSCALE